MTATSLECRLTAAVTTSSVTADADVGAATTYRVGGTALALVQVESLEDLTATAVVALDQELPIITIGRGSNLLIPDVGFDGIVVRLGDAFDTLTFNGDAEPMTVIAGAAASLPAVARKTVAESLTGFEWAVGVPGSMGGAVRMNAGGHGSDMSASTISASGIDLATAEPFTRSADELDFGYRTSSISPSECVTSVTLSLKSGDRERSTEELTEIVRWRRANQPGGQNAGSVFTNPPESSAGQLIDEAGCKGLRIGSAEVSTKHANFIQVDPDGHADDVLALMDEIVARVEQHSGITLHPETRIVGRNLVTHHSARSTS